MAAFAVPHGIEIPGDDPSPGNLPLAPGATLYTLHDTHGQRNSTLLKDAPRDVVARFLPENTYAADCHAFLLEEWDEETDFERLTLFDAGNGLARDGQLPIQLAARQVAPEDVTDIAITHLHGDHIGGLLDADGQAVFPRATLHIAAAEKAHWMAEDDTEQNPSPAVAAVLEAYAGRLNLFTQPFITSRVMAIPIPGHTPGHTAYAIYADAAEPADPERGSLPAVYIVGDLMHCLPVQLPHPEINMVYDMDTAQSAAMRRSMLERFAEAGAPWVAGMHFPFPGYGRIERRGEGFALLPPE